MSRSPRATASARSLALFLLATLGLVVLSTTACQYDRESRMAEIRELQAGGQFEDSIARLRVLLTAEADHPEANYRLGVALVQTGRPSLAIWPLQKASQSEEFNIQAGLLLASTLLSTEAYEEAIRAADQVLSIDPDMLAALQTRARANIDAGKPADALVDADHILSVNADDFMGTTLRVAALVDLDRLDEAEQAHIQLKEASEQRGDKDTAARSCAILARFYAHRGDLDKATETILGCFETYPTHSYVQQYTSDFFIELKRPDEAIKVWREAVDLAPEDLGLRAKLAQLLQKAGKNDEAEAVHKETVELFDTTEAWQQLGSFYRTSGRTTEAREAIEKALERSRKTPLSLQFALADVLIAEGNYDRAEEIASTIKEPSYRSLLRGSVKLAKGNPAEALKLLESGIRLWPNNAGARYLAGQAALQLGDLERALAEYREATRVDENATDAALGMARIYYSIHKYPAAQQFAERQIKTRPFVNGDAHVIAIRAATEQGSIERAESLVADLNARPGMQNLAVVEQAGIVRKKSGNEAAAKVVTESGLDLTDAANALAFTSLTVDLIALGKQDDALSRVGRALAKHPTDPTLLNIRARMLARMGKDAEAQASVDEALATNPDFAPALEVKAMYAEQAGDPKTALALYDRAAAADPENADYAYRAARLVVGLGETQEGTARLRKIVGMSPGHVSATNDLAWRLAEQGQDLDLALDLAKRAIQLDRRPETLDTLGWVQFKRGDFDEALGSFEASLASEPNAPSVRYRLALAQAKKGDADAARQSLAKALEVDSFPEVQAARAELARLTN